MDPGAKMATNDPIRFSFDERKAADAAALLLQLYGGEMSYAKLLKLLYVAERTSLMRYNRPIFGDRYVSMDKGPVLSRVYSLILSKGEPGTWWPKLIERRDDYDVRLAGPTNLGSLSEADIEILVEVEQLYRKFHAYRLSVMTHEEFQEWEDPKGSSLEIPVERLLQVLGKKDNDIRQIASNAREKAHLDRILGKT